MRGGRGGAAYMEESRAIPTATSFRTLTVTTLDARRRELKSGRMKVSFTHLIAYAIAHAARTWPVMVDALRASVDGKPPRIEGRAGELRPRRRRASEGRLPQR